MKKRFVFSLDLLSTSSFTANEKILLGIISNIENTPVSFTSMSRMCGFGKANAVKIVGSLLRKNVISRRKNSEGLNFSYEINWEILNLFIQVKPSYRYKNRTLSSDVRLKILKRDFYTCQYCGAHGSGIELHVDHKVPRVLGGSDDDSNLVTACQKCNLKKGSKTSIVANHAVA